MSLITEFETWLLSKYLVGTQLVRLDNSKLIESAISISKSLWIEWWGKLGSQILSLILKSSVIIKMLLMFASVFLRYFKANCEESEYILIRK